MSLLSVGSNRNLNKHATDPRSEITVKKLRSLRGKKWSETADKIVTKDIEGSFMFIYSGWVWKK